MTMVRLENRHGVAVYVTPGEVRQISPHKDDGITVIHTGDSFFNVKGTPDEVHAKLFPEKTPAPSIMDVRDVEDVESARAVLGTLASFSPTHWDLAKLHILARKALGREAP